MKKNILLFCCICYPLLGSAQSKVEYFPQEQLVHPNNKTQQEHNVYLHNVIKNKLMALLSQKRNLATLKKYRKDTLNLVVGFEVDMNGRVISEKNEFYINKPKLFEKLDTDVKKLISSLPKLKILHRKPESIVSRHFLYYRFVVHGKKNPELEYFPSKDVYKGGFVQEIPVFPGCENLSQKETAQCFQSMMQQHIILNFIYPTDALEGNISGTVDVVMDIAEDGTIKNLRVKGKPHGSLRREAFRIMELLPQLQPGKRNGKPDVFTYSVPVIFKL